MKHILITLLSLIAFSSFGQSWCCPEEYQVINPPPPYDSTFVLMSDSRQGIEYGRGLWQDAESAGLVRYNVYIAYLTQTGSNAPTATVIKNTYGETPVWARDSEGVYYATFQAEVFVNETPKTFGYIRPSHNTTFYWGEKSSSTVYTIHTLDDIGGTLTDGLLDAGYGFPVEIRTYY